jgi:L-lactate utilization protein LutB
MEEQAQDETLEEVLAAIRQDREALATVAGAVDKWKTACEEQRPPEEVLEIVDTWLEDNSPDNVEIFSWQVVYAEHWARVKAWRDKQ